jgi:hypothetical protein
LYGSSSCVNRERVSRRGPTMSAGAYRGGPCFAMPKDCGGEFE